MGPESLNHAVWFSHTSTMDVDTNTMLSTVYTILHGEPFAAKHKHSEMKPQQQQATIGCCWRAYSHEHLAVDFRLRHPIQCF